MTRGQKTREKIVPVWWESHAPQRSAAKVLGMGCKQGGGKRGRASREGCKQGGGAKGRGCKHRGGANGQVPLSPPTAPCCPEQADQRSRTGPSPARTAPPLPPSVQPHPSAPERLWDLPQEAGSDIHQRGGPTTPAEAWPAPTAQNQCCCLRTNLGPQTASRLHINLPSKQLGQNHSKILIYKEKRQDHFNFRQVEAELLWSRVEPLGSYIMHLA